MRTLLIFLPLSELIGGKEKYDEYGAVCSARSPAQRMTPGFHMTPDSSAARKALTLGRTPPSDWRQQFLAHLQNKMSGQKSTPPPPPPPPSSKLKSSPSVESFFPKGMNCQDDRPFAYAYTCII